MRSINVWDNFYNDFIIKYIANNTQKSYGKQLTFVCHLKIYFRIQIMHS